MRILKDDFESSQPISAVGCEWFNTVARFINKLTGSRGVTIDRSGEFPKVSLIAPSADNTSSTGMAKTQALVIAKNAMDPSWQDAVVPCPIDTTAETAATVAARHPTNVLAIPSGESAAQKQSREIADIGTSEYAARADHQHRLDGTNDTGRTDITAYSGYDYTVTPYAPITGNSWTRGNGYGVTIQIACRGTDNAEGAIFFRHFRFDKNGMLESISDEDTEYCPIVNQT